MIPARVHHFRDPTAVVLGLKELGQRGLTPRGVLFIALDPRGETHIAVPDDSTRSRRIRVGDKLTLKPPWEGRYFHFDAIHRLPGDTVLWNGDRRLGDTGSATEVACAVAVWLKGLERTQRLPRLHPAPARLVVDAERALAGRSICTPPASSTAW